MYLTSDSLLLNIMSDSGATEWGRGEDVRCRRMSQEKREAVKEQPEKSMW